MSTAAVPPAMFARANDSHGQPRGTLGVRLLGLVVCLIPDAHGTISVDITGPGANPLVDTLCLLDLGEVADLSAVL